MINTKTLSNSPVRKIKGKVERFKRSAATPTDTFLYTDKLKGFTVERVGNENRFFGYGVTQKANIKLLDVKRELTITTDDFLKLEIALNDDYFSAFPLFQVTETHRDELTNELSITAYDTLLLKGNTPISSLQGYDNQSYTPKAYIEAIAALLDTTAEFENIPADDYFLNLQFSQKANLNGNETVREVLDDLAELTLSIYYFNNNGKLIFKRLDKDGLAVEFIDKNKYFELDSKTNRRLAALCNATELGDNITASMAETGTTQYFRDNAFYFARNDVAALLEKALAIVGGLTFNQFNTNWRGNPAFEIGDKVAIENKSGEGVNSYLINDTFEYDGFLKEQTSWTFGDNENETESNPTNLGEKLNQTFARVDKANNTINIVAGETKTNSDAISALQLNTESIKATVEETKQETTDAITTNAEDIKQLNTNVSTLQQSASDLTLGFENIKQNGVDKITTKTGFTFNENGLTISKEDNEITTRIDNNGMIVSNKGNTVLTANNAGVDAVDLHASTYLIIGKNARLEDYGSDRTGCFYIGG